MVHRRFVMPAQPRLEQQIGRAPVEFITYLDNGSQMEICICGDSQVVEITAQELAATYLRDVTPENELSVLPCSHHIG